MPPITPQEATKSAVTKIPEAVFNVFNALIVASLSGGDKEAVVSQEDVMKVLVKQGFKRHEVYENNWLDIEPFYRKVGWKVEFDKPGYNEDYEATFTFKRR